MDILFADANLRRDCTDFDRAKRRWGLPAAKKLFRHLGQVGECVSFADLWKLKHLGLEQLEKRKGKREGQWAIRAKDGLRVVFFPVGDEATWRDSKGNLIWHKMNKIEIIEVTDYHDE